MENLAGTIVTALDMERLENLIQKVRDTGDRTSNNDIRMLENELEFADVVLPQEIASDVVTMRTTIKLKDLDSGDSSTYTIVFPTEADPERGQISILAPLAAAILGRRIGETIKFKAPSRLRRIRIEEILYQPESAGDFTL